MKTIAKFANQEEARVAKSFLIANGVEAIITGEQSLSVMPHLGMGSGSYQLMVDETDSFMAENLLSTVETQQKDPSDLPSKPQRKRQLFYIFGIGVAFFYLIANLQG